MSDKAARRIMVRFSGDTAEEPFIYVLGKEFDVVTNIVRAELSEDGGWMLLELEGTPSDVERAVEYISSRGVDVEEAGGVEES